MNVDNISKFAILLCNTKVSLYQSPDIQIIDGTLEYENNEIEVNAGALIKICQDENLDKGSKQVIRIQVLDYETKRHIYENLYECPSCNLQKVKESLWPFVIAIVDPEQRLRMIKNANQCQWVQHLKENDIVSVSGEMFGKLRTNYDCIIRYIGPVVELYCVGYFFCVEILVCYLSQDYYYTYTIYSFYPLFFPTGTLFHTNC